ncbi:MAG: galactose oxidase early set domain-containing protein [Thermoleophilia bacterium]
MTETSDSVLLPPANRQRWIFMGGGGIGDSDQSTARADIVDLRGPSPRYRPGPDLSAPTRYPNAVILPDDQTLVTGGAGDYRANQHSALLTASLLAPGGESMHRVADPTVPRSYHSSALLLPDGRVLTAGGDPLHDANGGPGSFELRMEIYSPPYLFRGPRPSITAGPRVLRRGATAVFTSPDAARITKVRLVRPSAVTHTTNLEQRSIAVELRVVRDGGAIAVTVPTGAGLTPPGWYMLFAVDRDGVPSVARWVRVR